MVKKLLILLLFFVAFKGSAFGFATIYTGIAGDRSISIKSNVDNVSVYLGNERVGIINGFFEYTPARKGGPIILTFQKAGYSTEKLVLNPKLSPFLWGNFLLGFFGSFGSSTDYSTGAATEYTPRQFFVDMKKL